MRTRLAVAFLLALGLLFAGCGGDDDGGGKGGAGGKGSISGTGYSLTLPKGWSDATKKTEGSAIRFDLLVGKEGGSFNTNVNVIREKLPDKVGLDDIRKIYRGQLGSVGATKISGEKPATVDGDEGFTYDYDQKASTGEQIHGRQVAVLHGGYAHTITLTAAKAKFASANDDFDAMLSSWRWK